MSGIAGILRFDGRSVDVSTVDQMLAAMHYRALDGMHSASGAGFALGLCRTVTTTAELNETQPLKSSCGRYVLVLDGRLEGRAAIAKKLGLESVYSDAQLTLAAWQRWGRDAPQFLQGDFAFAVVDVTARSIFCARDPGCARQLHYYHNDSFFLFATDVHALLASTFVSRTLNIGLVAEYLAGYWLSTSETFIKDILRLEPAQSLYKDERSFRCTFYWQPERLRSEQLSFQDTVEQYKELLARKVAETLQSQFPVAFEVSGGLDSTALYAMALKLTEGSAPPNSGIEGYSLAFEPEVSFPDEPYVGEIERYTARRIKRVAHTVLPIEWFQHQAQLYSCHPGYPNITMSLGLYETMVKEGHRSVVGGLGGDQWLGGEWLEDTHLYPEELRSRHLRAMTRRVAFEKESLGAARSMKRMLKSVLKSFLPGWAPYNGASQSAADYDAVLDWLSMELRACWRERLSVFVEKADHWQDKREDPHQTRLLQMYRDPWQRLAFEQAERITAVLGLELRHPYWSREIVQWAFDTPVHYLLKGGHSRFVHRAAMAAMLPQSILQRSDKAEFSVATDAQVARLSSSLLDSIASRREAWVDGARVESFHESYLDGKFDLCYDDLLWDLFAVDALASSS
ncbi:MAG: asparagine synthase-related protein [Cyanobacteria bacterium P01_F01_bin.3]